MVNGFFFNFKKNIVAKGYFPVKCLILAVVMYAQIRGFVLFFSCLFPFFTGYCQVAIQESNDKMFSYLKKSEFVKAEDFALKIVSEMRGVDTSVYLINAYTVLGITNKNKGFYSLAIDYNLIVKRLSEQKKDSARLSAVLNNIGVIYQLHKDYTKAIQFFSKSLKIENTFNNPLEKSIRYYNIAECYTALDSFDLALTYFSNSLLIEKKHNNIEGVLYASLGIVDVYLSINQLADAERFINKIGKDVSPDMLEVYVLYNKSKAEYAILTSQFKEAKGTLTALEDLVIKNNIKHQLLGVYELEIMLFEKTTDWKELSKAYKKYVLFSDEMKTVEVQNKMNDLIAKNELQKKDLEIKLIQEERDFKVQLNDFSGKVSVFLLLLLLFVVGFVMYGLRNK